MAKRAWAVAAGSALITAILGCEVFSHGDSAASQTAKLDTLIAPAQAKEGRYLYEDQISPGMKGYGLTVISGGKIERFDFEVIDVVKNFTPGNNAILIRCSGLGLEHSGIIAGMSGSPVYIKDKMIGAVAFGWGMAKDPIAGVQPIRQMLEMPCESKGEVQTAGGSRWAGNGAIAGEALKMPGWGKLAANLGKRIGRERREFAARGAASSAVDARGMRPLASPLMVSGVSAGSIKWLSQELAGTDLVPVASGSGGGVGGPGEKRLGGIAALKQGQIELAPGSSIAVPLLSGDMDLSAIGTVTEVCDGKVYALGHGFLAEGGTHLPIATSYIYSVMPNLQQSFKMGASLAGAGTLFTDEQRGIVGKIGDCPSTVPVSVSVKDGGSPPRIYKCQLAPHPKLTAEILNMMLQETLRAQRNLPGQYTAKVTGEATFAGGGKPARTIKIEHLGTTDSFNPMMPLVPVAILSDNPFENLRLTGLALEATIEHANRSARIVSVNVDRLAAAPGDEITAVVEMVRFHGESARVPVKLKIPADAADGEYAFTVGTAAMAMEQEWEYAPQHFDPQDIASLENAIERITAYQPERIYASLVMDVSGASVGGIEKRDLPASRMAIYGSSKRTDASPVRRVVRTEVDGGAVLEDGGQTFMMRVDRKANQRYYEPQNGMSGGLLQRVPRNPMTTQSSTTSAPTQPREP